MLWGGRFREPLHPAAKQFSFSLAVDHRLFWADIQVNTVWTAALCRQGLITEAERIKIAGALSEIAQAPSPPWTELASDTEDIHAYVETQVIAKIGDIGKKMHMGKSRNDQVATDLRLYTRHQIAKFQTQLSGLIRVLWQLASNHVTTMMPGFTHFQSAQPVSLAHHLLAYIEQFLRDRTGLRYCDSVADACPLGSAALAGNAYGIDREWVAAALGFSTVCQNSMDAVSDRDFIIEFLNRSALIMGHLSRLSEELVMWSSPLIGFVTLSDGYTTGSSIMPQKKNPDMAELIRGQSGAITGHWVHMVQLMKALPLTYNRDLQADKRPLFESVDIVSGAIDVMTGMLDSLTIHTATLKKALSSGHILATDIADHLARSGVPFRTAHEITGKIVQFAEDRGIQVHDLSHAELAELGVVNIDGCQLTFLTSLTQKSSTGGTAPDQIRTQLNRIKEMNLWLNEPLS